MYPVLTQVSRPDVSDLTPSYQGLALSFFFSSKLNPLIMDMNICIILI